MSRNQRGDWHASALLFIVLFGLAFGCSKSADPAGADSHEQEDPVASFKKTVESYLNGYKQTKHEKVYFIQSEYIPSGWRKAYSELVSDAYTMDVQKTDSLVSPYIGILEFNTRHYVSSPLATEQAVRSNAYFTDEYSVRKHRHMYAYQSGKWIVTSRKQLLWEDVWNDCEKEGE